MPRNSLLAASAVMALCASLSVAPAMAGDPDVALAALKTQVLSQGPNGEKPTAASTVTLSDDELAQVKAKHAKAALVFHYAGNDWSQAQLDALKAQFKTEGIEVVAVTDAGQRTLAEASDAAVAAEQRYLAPLTEAEAKAFVSMLQRLVPPFR